jgi:hypothetical protein
MGLVKPTCAGAKLTKDAQRKAAEAGPGGETTEGTLNGEA